MSETDQKLNLPSQEPLQRKLINAYGLSSQFPLFVVQPQSNHFQAQTNRTQTTPNKTVGCNVEVMRQATSSVTKPKVSKQPNSFLDLSKKMFPVKMNQAQIASTKAIRCDESILTVKMDSEIKTFPISIDYRRKTMVELKVQSMQQAKSSVVKPQVPIHLNHVLSQNEISSDDNSSSATIDQALNKPFIISDELASTAEIESEIEMFPVETSTKRNQLVKSKIESIQTAISSMEKSKSPKQMIDVDEFFLRNDILPVEVNQLQAVSIESENKILPVSVNYMKLKMVPLKIESREQAISSVVQVQTPTHLSNAQLSQYRNVKKNPTLPEPTVTDKALIASNELISSAKIESETKMRPFSVNYMRKKENSAEFTQKRKSLEMGGPQGKLFIKPTATRNEVVTPARKAFIISDKLYLPDQSSTKLRPIDFTRTKEKTQKKKSSEVGKPRENLFTKPTATQNKDVPVPTSSRVNQSQPIQTNAIKIVNKANGNARSTVVSNVRIGHSQPSQNNVVNNETIGNFKVPTLPPISNRPQHRGFSIFYEHHEGKTSSVVLPEISVYSIAGRGSQAPDVINSVKLNHENHTKLLNNTKNESNLPNLLHKLIMNNVSISRK